MTPRKPAIVSAVVAALAALSPAGARAVGRGCSAIAIEPDSHFRSRFPDLLARIQGELAARTDIDACAHVELTLQAETVLVSVTLPDGRAAARRVTRPEDVLPALQALLLVPEPAAVAPVAAPALALAPARPALQASRANVRERDVLAPTLTTRRQLGFELSVISGARIGDGQFGYGAGVLSFLEIGGWLVGFEGRADGYRSVYGSDPQTALELALLGGRRWDLGNVALDLSAGPAIAMKGLALSQTQAVSVQMVRGAAPPAPPAPHSESSTGAVPRLLVGARLGFSPRSVFRTFVGIDGELGPAQGAADSASSSENAARLPAFSVGLALGATVGTP